MKKPARIALGIVTILPLLWMATFFGFMFYMSTLMFARSKTPAEAPNGMPDFFPYIFLGQMIAILLIFALTAFYVVYLFRTPKIPSDKKVLWAVILFFGNAMAFPVFWYLYIWREAENGG